MTAILIDGNGTTRLIDLPSAYPIARFARPRNFLANWNPEELPTQPTIDVVEFKRLHSKDTANIYESEEAVFTK